MEQVEIGLGKLGHRAYSLDEVTVVPNRRTRDPDDVALSWQIDAYRFDIPVMVGFSDSITSPATAVKIGQLGGLAVLDLEGIWTRHENPVPDLMELAELPPLTASRRLRELYSKPVIPDLISERISQIAAAGVRTAGRVRPPRVVELAPYAVAAYIDLFVIAGTVVSAEHVSSRVEPLNLKTFIRGMETPVVVGGCVSYRAARHLMRTGAAGVLVSAGSGSVGTSSDVLGFKAPLATALADVRAARMRHLDETGVYCHVIAGESIATSGDIAKAIACGADAVMLGKPLASASDSPCPGLHWNLLVGNTVLPRAYVSEVAKEASIKEILHGPALSSSGTTNMMGGLRSSMAKCGYVDVKDFQRAHVAVVQP